MQDSANRALEPLHLGTRLPEARFRGAVVFVLAFALFAALTHDAVFLAGNDAARFAEIEARVDLGETAIDRSRYAWTEDRVTIDGREYSNKPPLLALIGSGLYFSLKRPLGLSFDTNEPRTVYVLTLLLSGLACAWLSAGFFAALGRHFTIDPAVRVLLTVGLAAGSLLTSFAGTLNSHTVTALLLFTAHTAAWRGAGARAGFLLGLAGCMDAPPALVFLPLLAVVVRESGGWRGLFQYLLSCAGLALVCVTANLTTVGSPLPPKLVPGAIDNSSRFSDSIAGVILPDRWSYPLECLFGWHGFFSVSPILLFGALGLVRAIRRGRPFSTRWSALVAAGCAIVILGHITLAGAFGGWSYGFRYLIPLIPLLLFFAPLALESRGARIAFAGALLFSVATALIGVYHPWPPGYERKDGNDPVAELVSNPVGGNLAAFATEHFPDSRITARLCRTFIQGDKRERQLYLYVFFVSKGDNRQALKLAHALDPGNVRRRDDLEHEDD